MAFKAFLSLMDLSIILGVKESSSFILVLEVLDIFNGINITRFLKDNQEEVYALKPKSLVKLALKSIFLEVREPSDLLKQTNIVIRLKL